MDDKPTKTGFWTLPQGLEGAIPAVIEALNRAELPAHDKAAMVEKIKSESEGTEYNFVKIFAHQSRNDGQNGRDTHLTIHITTSKKLI